MRIDKTNALCYNITRYIILSRIEKGAESARNQPTCPKIITARTTHRTTDSGVV